MSNFIFDLLSEWVNVDAGIKKAVKVLEQVHQNGLSAPALGVLQKTKNSSLSVEEVLLSGVPSLDVEEGEIKKVHGQPVGAWGTTRVNAVIYFALRQGKDGSFSALPVKAKVGALITLKPESYFKTLKDFAPHYRRLMTDFGGRKEEFCAAMATQTFKDYGKFGTVDGVLYHELVHYSLAKKFARQLLNRTVKALSGKSSETRESATTDFIDVVDQEWSSWRGLILHDEQFLDERFVWHQECAYYIKAYESAGKPGY